MPEILACIDFSDVSESVLAAATRVAAGYANSLHLLHVAAGEPEIAGYDKDSIATFTRDDRAGQLLDEHNRLRELAATAEASSPGIHVEPLVVMGDTIDTIFSVADRIDAAVIAIGSHGHGALHHLLVGSVAAGVLKHSHRPVLVVPSRPG